MSTKAERQHRANRKILPIRIPAKQKDGNVVVQRVDADVREDKRRRPKKKD